MEAEKLLVVPRGLNEDEKLLYLVQAYLERDFVAVRLQQLYQYFPMRKREYVRELVRSQVDRGLVLSSVDMSDGSRLVACRLLVGRAGLRLLKKVFEQKISSVEFVQLKPSKD